MDNVKKNKYEIDMTSGSLFTKILIFSLPLMLSGILQLLFNAADLIVIGQYSNKQALAAVGATSSLINFFINVIIGISVGCNVVVARFFGAGKQKEIHDSVHTSICICIILAVSVGITAFILSKPILRLMDTPDDIIDLAALYVHIYFAGLPATMLYNFGSAILRAVGDTKRPLYFLAISGVLNVILNLFFVIKLGMSVDGVALATVISQCLSAYLVLRCLIKSEAAYKLIIRDIRINKNILKKIIAIGLPAGIQGMIFSVSNLLIQSSINFFGADAMAGSTACQNIEGFVYTSMNAIYQTALSFTSQNYGAGKFKRIKSVLFQCLFLVTAVGLILGNLVYLYGAQLIGLYSSDSEVIHYGLIRMKIICTTYCTCGIMEVFCGIIRGLGYGILPMVVSLIGACGLRILWIFTIFQKMHTLNTLYMSYPITWTITIIAHAICLIFIWRKKISPLQKVQA